MEIQRNKAVKLEGFINIQYTSLRAFNSYPQKSDVYFYFIF